jgi:hypothetical protein
MSHLTGQQQAQDEKTRQLTEHISIRRNTMERLRSVLWRLWHRTVVVQRSFSLNVVELSRCGRRAIAERHSVILVLELAHADDIGPTEASELLKLQWEACHGGPCLMLNSLGSDIAIVMAQALLCRYSIHASL